MRHAIKNLKKIVKAYPLGCNHPMELMLLEKGRIKKREDGLYELFSKEAVHGVGQLAKAEDYFKVNEDDGEYYPYPNEKEWFEENHIHIQGDEYEQKSKPLEIWQAGDPVGEEIRYLCNQGKLILKPETPECYFNATLWGTDLSAPVDATIVFYGVSRDKDGRIEDISFNFVRKEEFEKTYTLL